jgi:hypothetical protein
MPLIRIPIMGRNRSRLGLHQLATQARNPMRLRTSGTEVLQSYRPEFAHEATSRGTKAQTR